MTSSNGQPVASPEAGGFADDGWLYVGHESEIRGDGAFRRRTVGGRPLFMVRGSDGQVRVFFNTCTHRGALVCRQDQGRARSFQCFYHAWTFDNDGALVGVPGEEAYGPGWRREELGLRSPARTGAYRGFQFVSLDPGAGDLEACLGDGARALDRVAERSPGGWTVAAGSERFVVAAPWPSVVAAAVEPGATGAATRVCRNLLVYPREAVSVCRVEPRPGGATELDTVLLLPEGSDEASVRDALRSAREAGPAGVSLLGRLDALELQDHPTHRPESGSE